MEALSLTEGPGIQLRTYNSEYRFTFKWTIEKFSEIPVDIEERSPEFSVEPQSKWYGELKRMKTSLYLHLNRNAEISCTVNYSASIADRNSKILYKCRGQYTCPAEKSRHDVLEDMHFTDVCKIESAPNDQLLITVFLKVTLPRKTVGVNHFSLTSDLQQKQLEALSRDFKNILDNSTEADVTLIVQGESMAVHKTILCARSSVFASMLRKGLPENDDNVVHIEDISMSTMKALISFMYSGLLVDYDFDTAMKVYYAADKFFVMELRDICGCILVSKLTPDITSKVLNLADMHRDLVLRDKVMQYIAYHGQE